MLKDPTVLLIGINYAPEVTGIAPYSAGLLIGLGRLGIPVSAITTHPHYPQWEFGPDGAPWSIKESVDGVSVHRVRHFLPRPPTLLRRLLSEISFGLRAAFSRWGNPDVVVLVSPALFASAICQLRIRLGRRRPKSVLWIQDLYGTGIAETGGGSRSAALVGRIESALIRSVDRVIAIHQAFADAIVAQTEIDRDRVSIIRNWSHVAAVEESTNRDATRTRHGWAPDETVVLHAGNMGVKQGLEHVVAAARIAAQRQLPVRFVLLGDGSRRDALAAAGVGIETLSFVDPLDSPLFEATLAAADVLLVNEAPGVATMSVPSKLTTYFSTGRPVLAAVGSDGATASEIDASGGGVIVAPDDPGALLDAAVALHEDPHGSTAMGTAGLRYRREILSADAAIDAFAGIVRRWQ